MHERSAVFSQILSLLLLLENKEGAEFVCPRFLLLLLLVLLLLMSQM